MFVLDTNVLSELRKKKYGRADAKVIKWESARPSSTLFVSVISLMELERGVFSMERRDPAQGGLLRAWLDHQLVPAFAGRVLPVDAGVAVLCAALHVPNPRPDKDALIAATALAHGMTVVTRNVADFVGTGVRVLNPWLG